LRFPRFFFAAVLIACSRALAIDQTADATAKFLAGMPVRDTPLESYVNFPGWTMHALDFDKAWKQLEQRQLTKIRTWAPEALGTSYQDTGPMYYMFSGPDFLYANAFFPNASTYILCGVEPVGAIPDVTKVPRPALGSALANLRKSLDSVELQFFHHEKHEGGSAPAAAQWDAAHSLCLSRASRLHHRIGRVDRAR
jgi:hypothetical protein